MTEQKIEKIILDKFNETFATSNVNGYQLIGAWQAVEDGQVKAIEDGTSKIILGVKVYPRSYSTPTIPDGQFQVDISLTVRAEVDSTGKDYLEVTQLVSNILHTWQKSYQAYSIDFYIEDEFKPTGFNIESGDVGLDKEACIWQYTQTFNLYGIIS